MGRKAKARELIRGSLLREEKGWSQLLKDTGLAKGALSMNLRRMQKEREVVYELKSPGRSKLYRLSDQGVVRASISAISRGVTGQITHVLEKLGRTNPSEIRDWINDGKNLNLEIRDPSLGRVKLTLQPEKQKS